MTNDSQELNFRNKIIVSNFILSIFVVLLHTYNVAVYDLTSGPVYLLECFLMKICSHANLGFFLISGFLFFRRFDYSMLITKWKSRIKSILIPYFFWNIVAYLYYLVLFNVPLIKKSINQSIEPISISSIISNALIGNHNITWFLRYLFAYIIISSLLYCLFKNMKVMIFLIMISVAFGFNNQFCYYFVFYLIGAFLAIHYPEFFRKTCYDKKNIAVSLIVLIVLSMLRIIFTVLDDNPFILLLGFACLWVIFDFISLNISVKWWTKISFFIFCTHSMLLESVEKIILIILGKSQFAALIDFVLAPAITISIIFAVAYILRKNKYIWSFINGGRG